MSNNDKKWASNKKDQLLVENFRNFMKEGEFKATEELNEFGGMMRGIRRMGSKLTGGHAMGAKNIQKKINTAAQAYSLIDKAELSDRTLRMIAQKISQSIERYALASIEDAIGEVEANGKSVPPAMAQKIDDTKRLVKSQRWDTIATFIDYVAPFLKELTKYGEYVNDQGDRDRKMGDREIYALGHSIGSVFEAIQELLTKVAQAEDMVEFSKIDKIIKSKKFKDMEDFEKDNLVDRLQTVKKSFEADLKNIL